MAHPSPMALKGRRVAACAPPRRLLDHSSCRRTRRMRSGVCCRAQSKLLALDFDGVLCDSCGESSISAWKAASALWPSIFGTEAAAAAKDDVLERMRAVRPVVETGYENIVQVRALLEGISVEDMLDNWQSMLPEKMTEWSLERSALVQLFGTTRDKWMEADLDSWLAPNRIYDGVTQALKDAMAAPDNEVYIVTTKQERFAQTILFRMAGVDFPLDRIYSQTVSGRPKSEVLEMLQARHEGFTCHFVEDKLSTLQKVMQVQSLQGIQLYLVDWGYNTARERAFAADSGRIQVVNTEAFTDLLTT